MTAPWNEAADEAIAHNLADVFENGPRLTTNRKTAALAIDRKNKYVLKTGLGAMGVGTMWCSYSYREEDPEWADLPERDSTGEFGTATYDSEAAFNAELSRLGVNLEP